LLTKEQQQGSYVQVGGMRMQIGLRIGCLFTSDDPFPWTPTSFGHA
jgi:hypothetical protein